MRLKIGLVVAACALLAGSASGSSQRAVRLGSPPHLPRGARVVGALASSAPVQLTVTLQPRDPAALAQYAAAVSTPGSAVFRHYLSVPEFRQRFGPTDAQAAAVQASLRSHGLKTGTVSSNGLAIPVRSNAGAVARAFAIAFQRVALPSGRTAFANTQAPSLDPSIARVVQGVVGLDNVAVPKPLAVRPRLSLAPHLSACSGASGTGVHTAQEIAGAYGFSGLYGAGDFGAGQTVALYELEGNFPADITAYKTCYGITTGSVSYVTVDGGPPAPMNQDGLETELDVENVVGLAPAANVQVYQAPDTDFGAYQNYATIISANTAKAISTSWGLCEPLVGAAVADSENTLFQEAATQGQSLFAASGDSGSSDCGGSSPAVDDPGSQPFVTGVGGTHIASLGPPPSESVWNNGAGASGGGISTIWPRPSYQSGVPGTLNATGREVPDISADADPSTGYAIYWHGLWNGVGGTSGAAPLWAALTAEVNAFSACRGTPIGFANPMLYGTAGHVYAGHFNDVTTGGNGLYPAGPGYDMASGLGTPNAATLATNLCAPAIGVSNPGPQTSRIHQAVGAQVLASDSAGNAVNYSASGLPPGLSINGATGAISGAPNAAGVYTVTVRATDKRGAFGTTAFGWTVQGVPRQTRGSLTGIAKGHPKLVFTLAAGTDAPQLKQLVVSLPRGLSFARKARTLKRGVRVSGGSYKVRGGKLTITLKGGLSQVRVTIAAPALSASRTVARRKRVTVGVHVTDVSGYATSIRMKLRPS